MKVNNRGTKKEKTKRNSLGDEKLKETIVNVEQHKRVEITRTTGQA